MSQTVSEVMDDGALHFKVRAKDGSESEHAVDVLLLRLTCQECEETHQLEEDKNHCYKPTAAFLQDLAGRMQGLGVEGCTPSIAWQLWRSSAAGLAALKKNWNETPSSDSGSASSPEEPAQMAS